MISFKEYDRLKPEVVNNYRIHHKKPFVNNKFHVTEVVEMKKKDLFKVIILGFLFFSVALSSGSESQMVGRLVPSILENEKKINEKYTNDYEAIEEKLTDRLGENGEPMSVKEFIRPQETTVLMDSLKIRNLDLEGRVKRIHSFVRQNFEFVPDEEGEDYWQTPAETIRRKKGDCEDLSILLSSMLIAAGVSDVRVNAKNWHVYTTVSLNGKTLILETDPNPSHSYLYEWPQFRWNQQIIQERKRK